MTQVIDPELEELERIRWKAGLDEAHALAQARAEAEKSTLNRLIAAGLLTRENAKKFMEV
ncbi:MAG: hypothetical protein LBM98_05050 [Oscillospiraceae bacterium]|jgi:hypothetical protein|nr:hypothetical protein [Oscillospiraceae bacterium]